MDILQYFLVVMWIFLEKKKKLNHFVCYICIVFTYSEVLTEDTSKRVLPLWLLQHVWIGSFTCYISSMFTILYYWTPCSMYGELTCIVYNEFNANVSFSKSSAVSPFPESAPLISHLLTSHEWNTFSCSTCLLIIIGFSGIIWCF